MGKMLFSLAMIATGLIVGRSLRWFETKIRKSTNQDLPKYIVVIRTIVLLGLNPLIVMSSFWILSLNDAKLFSLPILGFCALALGGIFSLIASKLLKHDKKKTGAMFVSGSFTNLGTFGGLICFAFFGEKSFALVALYKLFEELYYYLIGYPFAKSYGTNDNQTKSNLKSKLKYILTDPYILTYFSSIVLGFILNISGLIRPAVFGDINSTLIPIISVLLVSTVGYSMKFGKVWLYIKECLVISVIKFIITPAIIILIAVIIGLPSIENSLVLKVVIVLSFMPTAFNALIPPQIYNLDKDLANSVWLFTTGMLLFIVPILSFVI